MTEPSLHHWLEDAVARSPDAPALISVEETVSFAELRVRARRLAAGLAEIGMKPGEVLALQEPNSVAFAVVWLGAALGGQVLQTLHTPYGPAEAEPLIRHSGAKVLIGPPKLSGIEGVRFIPIDALPQDQGSGAGEPPKPPVGSDPYVQLYTSGTTSSPKGVRSAFTPFMENAKAGADLFSVDGSDRILCLPPYTHLYGLNALEMALYAGAASCLLPAFTPQAFVEALRKFRPTLLIAGPAHIAACLQQNLLTKDDLSSIRTAKLSGTTVPPALSAALEALMTDGRVVQAWGMTELQVGACSRRDDPERIRFDTIGRALPGIELRVADDEDRPVAAHDLGQLQVRGNSVFSGYVDNPEANAQGFTADGWFRTGDLATMDEGGNVTLAGRTKDLINRGGVKFNPLDVEILVASHPAVTAVAVAPLPDPILGERACCFVSLKPGTSLDLEALRAFLTEHGVAKLKWPERVEVVAEMPLTPTRKIIKAELVKRLMAEA